MKAYQFMCHQYPQSRWIEPPPSTNMVSLRATSQSASSSKNSRGENGVIAAVTFGELQYNFRTNEASRGARAQLR
jgi:hypothetical protein